MSDENMKPKSTTKAATAEDDHALKFAMIGFLGVMVFAASAFVTFPSMGAVFIESYKQQYEAKVTESFICRF